MDENLANKFESITRTILSNQTQALTNLTSKVNIIYTYIKLGKLLIAYRNTVSE